MATPHRCPQGHRAIVIWSDGSVSTVPRDRPEGPLTRRQTQIIQLAANGHFNKEIARILHISEHTVKRHWDDIFGRLSIDGGEAQAVAAAFRLGLIA